MAGGLTARPDGFIPAKPGYGSNVDRDRAEEAGCDKYLIKRVDLDVLCTWLQSLA